MTFALGTRNDLVKNRCDDLNKPIVRVLQNPILGWILLDIIKYFLHIIYIVKLLKTFLIAYSITIADAVITIVTMTFALNTRNNLAETIVGVPWDPSTYDDLTKTSRGVPQDPRFS